MLEVWTDVPKLHIVNYFAGTAVFMSLQYKPIITLTTFMSLPTVFMQFISP